MRKAMRWRYILSSQMRWLSFAPIDSICDINRPTPCLPSPCSSGWLRHSLVWRQKMTPLEDNSLEVTALSEAPKQRLAAHNAELTDLEGKISTICSKINSIDAAFDRCLNRLKAIWAIDDVTDAIAAERSELTAELILSASELETSQKELENYEQELSQCARNVHVLVQELRDGKKALSSERRWYQSCDATLERFLSGGLKRDCGVALSHCYECNAFCNVLPPDLRSYLATVKHPVVDREKWIWPTTSDDRYRLLMADVAGSLIKKHGLDTFEANVARQQVPDGETNTGVKAVELALLGSLNLLETYCKSRNEKPRCHFEFEMNVTLFETSVLQLVTDRVRVGNILFPLICPWMSYMHLSECPRSPNTLHADSIIQRGIANTTGVVLVSGASGSGKSMSALMSAGPDGVVWLVTLGDFRFDDVVETVKKHVETIGRPITSKFEGNFVLVIDEAGCCPKFVKSLCRRHRELCDGIAVALNLDPSHTRIVVCGTGVERPDSVPLSVPIGSYHLINMSDAAQELSFFRDHTIEKIATTHKLPFLAAVLRSQSPSDDGSIETDVNDLRRHSVVLACRRLLQNRRITAFFLVKLCAFVATFTRLNDDNIDDLLFWPTELATIMQEAIWQYRAGNQVCTNRINLTFGEALAMCLGGPYQYKVLSVTHNQEYFSHDAFSHAGLVCDRRVMSVTPKSLAAPQELGDGPAPDQMQPDELRFCGLPCDDYQTVVEQHGMRCFSMTSAMVEAGLCGFADLITTTQRDASALEDSLARIVLLWMHAHLKKVRIDLTLPENLSDLFRGAEAPVEDVKCAFAFLELLQWSMTDAPGKHVAHIQLGGSVTSVRASWIAAQNHSSDVATPGDVIRAVITNGPCSSFGNLIVVVGRKGEADPVRCLIIQSKYRLNRGEALNEAAAASEHHNNTGIVDATSAKGTEIVDMSPKQRRFCRRGPEVKSLVLCCAHSTVKSTHVRGAGWHTIVLNEPALRMALRPVELDVPLFDNRPPTAPRALRVTTVSIRKPKFRSTDSGLQQ